MSWNHNPVDAPHEFGFDEVVGVVDISEPSYSFDLLAVLKNAEGYFLSTDSGCSCPSPFESHTADDFTGPLTAEQAREEARNLYDQAYRSPYEPERFAALLDRIV